MTKYVWFSTLSDKLLRVIWRHLAVSRYKYEHPDWAVRAIKRFYERRRVEKQR